jgi:hypothetical protein
MFEVTPDTKLSSAVVVLTPSSLFSSSAVAVTGFPPRFNVVTSAVGIVTIPLKVGEASFALASIAASILLNSVSNSAPLIILLAFFYNITHSIAYEPDVNVPTGHLWVVHAF